MLYQNISNLRNPSVGIMVIRTLKHIFLSGYQQFDIFSFISIRFTVTAIFLLL